MMSRRLVSLAFREPGVQSPTRRSWRGQSGGWRDVHARVRVLAAGRSGSVRLRDRYTGPQWALRVIEEHLLQGVDAPRRDSREASGRPMENILWRWPRLLAVAGLLFAAAVSAEVQLATSVDRIVHLTTAAGGMQTLLLDAARVRPGEELRYTIEFTNDSSEFIPPDVIVITNPIPETAEYLAGTATGAGTEILFSVDGGASFAAPEALTVVDGGVALPATEEHYTTIRWIFGYTLGPGESRSVAFDVRLHEESLPEEVFADGLD